MLFSTLIGRDVLGKCFLDICLHRKRFINISEIAETGNLAEDSSDVVSPGRQKEGRKATPTASVVDSQSVNTTDVGGAERGFINLLLALLFACDRYLTFEHSPSGSPHHHCWWSRTG